MSLSKIDCSDDVLNFVLLLCHRTVIYKNPPIHRHIARPPEGVVMPKQVSTLFQYHPRTAGKQFHLCHDERVVLCTQARCAECTKTFVDEPIWVLCKITEYIRCWCDSPSTVARRQQAKTPHPRKVWLGSSEIEIIEEEGSLPTFVLISLGSSSSCLKCKWCNCMGIGCGVIAHKASQCRRNHKS